MLLTLNQEIGYTGHGELSPYNSETAGYLDREWPIVDFHILTHQPH